MWFSEGPSPHCYMKQVHVAGTLLAMLSLSAVGCGNQPVPPAAPLMNAAAAALQAMSMYDHNNDGVLGQEELKLSPALSTTAGTIDQDENGKLSQDEIQRHLSNLFNTNTILVDAMTEISLNNRPLAGATITLEPEPFLGNAFSTVTAVTDRAGMAGFTGHDPTHPGVYLGLYTVRVSKIENGRELIPEKYNRASELGLEVTAGQSNLAIFSLRR